MVCAVLYVHRRFESERFCILCDYEYGDKQFIRAKIEFKTHSNNNHRDPNGCFCVWFGRYPVTEPVW